MRTCSIVNVGGGDELQTILWYTQYSYHFIITCTSPCGLLHASDKYSYSNENSRPVVHEVRTHVRAVDIDVEDVEDQTLS
jgi:hypothetical protein